MVEAATVSTTFCRSWCSAVVRERASGGGTRTRATLPCPARGGARILPFRSREEFTSGNPHCCGFRRQGSQSPRPAAALTPREPVLSWFK